MTNPKIKTINVHELKNQMAHLNNWHLIDVRELEEWRTLRIPGAIHVPKDYVAAQIESLVPDKTHTLYLHCKGGVRSLYAAQCLLDLGYTEVYSVDGGIMEWAQAGYPVEQ